MDYCERKISDASCKPGLRHFEAQGPKLMRPLYEKKIKLHTLIFNLHIILIIVIIF